MSAELVISAPHGTKVNVLVCTLCCGRVSNSRCGGTGPHKALALGKAGEAYLAPHTRVLATSWGVYDYFKTLEDPGSKGRLKRGPPNPPGSITAKQKRMLISAPLSKGNIIRICPVEKRQKADRKMFKFQGYVRREKK